MVIGHECRDTACCAAVVLHHQYQVLLLLLLYVPALFPASPHAARVFHVATQSVPTEVEGSGSESPTAVAPASATTADKSFESKRRC